MPKRLQPPFEQKLGLILLAGNQPNNVLIQPGRSRFCLDVRVEPVLVLLLNKSFDRFCCCTHLNSGSFWRNAGRRHAPTSRKPSVESPSGTLPQVGGWPAASRYRKPPRSYHIENASAPACSGSSA